MTPAHVMIDLETLGTKPFAKILTIGARNFDLQGPGEESFYGKIDRQKWEENFHEDEKTLKWWENQSDEARKEAFSGTATPQDVLSELALWIEKLNPKTVWCKGTHFDITLLAAALHTYEITVPWVYNAPRCMRSVVQVIDPDYRENAAHLTANLLPHHALADSDRQIFELTTALLKVGLPIR